MTELAPQPLTPKAPRGMRTFTSHRQVDQSGVSGTGVVLEGVEFSTGLVIVHWLTPPPMGSLNVFMSMQQFLDIHINPHPGNVTTITWGDGEEQVYD